MSEKSSAFGASGRRPSALLFLVCAWVALVFAVPARAQPGLSSQTRAQINAIQDEKTSRSPAFRKLDSQLIYALRQQRYGRAVTAASTLKAAVQPEVDGRIAVDIDAEIRPELIQFISQQGGEVRSQFPRYRTLRAMVPLASVETLAARPEVRFIQPAVRAQTRAGAVVSEGDMAHQANLFRSEFLLGGAGLKIGVLSDSATYYEESQKRGELPAVTILPGELGYGTGEGTAMMEIIHDLAPDSELYFATAFGSVAGFADNIRRLYDAGCRIIVDDVIYFNESPFQDAPIAQAVKDVSAGGALFFSSAGNEGNLTHNTAGTWEGDFNDGGPVSIGRGGRIHSFGGTNYNTVIPGGGFRRLDLFWADPLGQSTNDYDLYVLDADGNVVRSSTNLQTGQQDPYEWIGTLNDGERVVIVKYAGADRFLHLSAFRGRLAVVTSGSTRGHNASGAANAFSVAATEAPKPPAAFQGGAANPVEGFSSDGPRRIFFYPDGQPITPADFSSTGGLVLQKPDLTAADGVATSVFGFEQFYGTSAAAPHAAAVAALIWSYNPGLTPDEIRTALTTGVLDIEVPGWDQDSGAGIPMLPLMMNLVPAPSPKLTLEEIQFADANGSGALDANECAEIHVVLRNLIGSNGHAATGVTTVLTGDTTGLFVSPVAQAFPDVPPGGVATNILSFRISSDSTYACWRGAVLQLQVNSDNAGSYLFPIPIVAMTNAVGLATEYAGTSLPLPIPDTGTLESSVTVEDFAAPIGEVTVSLHVQHTYDSDLHISLLSPDGTEIVLSANRGGSGENFGTDCATRTVFSDHATSGIGSSTAPFVGTFRPETPLAALWGRTGAEVNGNWTLKVTDGVELDTGTLVCWTLSLAPAVCLDIGDSCLVPAAIVQAPGHLVVTNGDTAQFTVSATGTEPLTYIWLFNETNALIESSSTLSLTNLLPEQAGTYTVIVSNFYGTATSLPAELTVLVRPFIATQPSNLVATNGDTVAFAVVAGGTELLNYQWFFNETTALLEGTNAILVLTNISLAHVGTYTVRVDNEIGSVTSAPALLTVLVGPGIEVEPGDLVVTNGDLARLEVVASGSEPLSYQWWHDETNALAGATGPVLELAGITPEQAGSYAVEVSNAVAVVRSREAVVTVYFPPQIHAQPESHVVAVGATVEFAVGAAGSPAPNYQWYFAVTNLLPSQTSTLPNPTNALAGATNASLVLSNVSLAVAGAYAVVVSNLLGSVTTEPALLAVLVKPGIEVEPVDLVVTNGGLARLEVVASGSEPLSYQWWHDETNALAGATGPVLELAGITPEQAGWYAVEVSNAVGSVRSRSAMVTVYFPPQIHAQPESLALPRGTTAEFAVSASGFPVPNYQWFFNVTNSLPDETNAVLIRTNAQAADVGSYQVEVSNVLGVVTSSVAMLLVDDPPVVLTHPQNLTIRSGQTATFQVQGASSLPLDYYWYFAGTNLVSTASGSTLVRTNVMPIHSGPYHAVATNAFGATASQTAALRVLVPGMITDFTRTDNAFDLTFSTVPGLRYTVEYSINLAPNGWFRVSGASKLLAIGEFMTVHDSAATNAYRFYRVLVE